jgi:ATP-binding cassette subfamily B protein
MPRVPSSRVRYFNYRRKTAKKAGGSEGGAGGGGGGTIETKKKDAKASRGRSFFVLMRAFWGYLAGHRHIVGMALTTLTLSTVIGLIIPASTKIAIDYIITDAPGPSGLPAWVHEWAGGETHVVHADGANAEGVAGSDAQRSTEELAVTGQRPVPRDGVDSAERKRLLWMLACAMASLVLLNVAVATWGRWQMTRLTKRVAAQMRREAFEHAVRLPLNRLGSFKTGGVVSILREDAGAASELLFSIIYNPWRAIVQLVGTLFVLAWVDWRMLVGGIAVIPATWLTHRTWINKIRPIYQATSRSRGSRMDAHRRTEAFGGMRVVRGFGRYRGEATRFTLAHHYMRSRQEILVWWWSRILEIVWAILIPGARRGRSWCTAGRG